MLTAEQQQIILDSLWVVNTVLKTQGLSMDNDMRQSAILYLCKCLLRFDDARGVKWTTYAFKSIYFFVKKRNMHQKREQDDNLPLEAAEYMTGSDDVFDIIDEIQCSIEQKYGSDCADVFKLMSCGYHKRDIYKELHITLREIEEYMEIIKDEVSENLQKN